MRFNSVSKEQLSEFKQRAINAEIEPGVVEMCKIINLHPSFVTMWSCEGHTDPPGQIHIVFCCTDGQEAIIEKLMTELYTSSVEPLWQLTHCRLYHYDKWSPDVPMTMDNSYPVWKISYNYLLDIESLNEVRTAFTNSIKRIFI